MSELSQHATICSCSRRFHIVKDQGRSDSGSATESLDTRGASRRAPDRVHKIDAASRPEFQRTAAATAAELSRASRRADCSVKARCSRHRAHVHLGVWQCSPPRRAASEDTKYLLVAAAPGGLKTPCAFACVIWGGPSFDSTRASPFRWSGSGPKRRSGLNSTIRAARHAIGSSRHPAICWNSGVASSAAPGRAISSPLAITRQSIRNQLPSGSLHGEQDRTRRGPAMPLHLVAHSTDNNAACSSTVCVAFSCMSGG